MALFKFILGLNFIFHCFKLIIVHYLTQEQWEDKIKTKDKIGPRHVLSLTGCLLSLLQVDFVIRESRSLDNLSQMYEGWTAWV